MRDEILKLIAEKPKHYSRIIEKNEEMYLWILEQTSDLPETINLPERIYCILNGIEKRICHHGNTKKFKTIKDGYAICKRGCACHREEIAERNSKFQNSITEEQRKEMLSKTKKTNVERYGVEHSFQADAVKEKIKETNIKKYGHESHNSSEVVKEKKEKTNQKKYGVRNVFQSDEIKEKTKASNFEKYGTKSHNSSEIVKENKKKTYLKKFGVENPMRSDEIQSRAKQTIMERYGVDNVLKSKEIREKIENTNLEKYGSRQFLGSPAVREKIRNASFAKRYSHTQDHISDDAFNILHNKELFLKTFESKSVMDFAKDLNVSYSTIIVYANKYGIVFPAIRSSYENILLNFFETHEIKVRTNDRTILKPKELDFVSDEHKIAIEFNGLYWHSELKIDDKKYHLKKLEKCLEKGYRLIQIFEDEWVNKREIVEQRLLHAFGKSPKGIGARKLVIKKVSANCAWEFFNLHHTQGGFAQGHARYGAYDGDTLVAVMSFSRPRAALGRRSGAVELLRYATDGRSHAGVAGRLFRAYVRDYNPSSIISYADRRWSEGPFYEKLGFKFLRNTDINYWYVSPNSVERFYRYRFRKSEIKDLVENGDQKTERQIMHELGYYRIYDCGSKLYEWNNHSLNSS